MSKFRNMLVNNKGFTLIELLVVIAVLGILAAIAIPRLTGVTDTARQEQLRSTANSLRSSIEMHIAETGAFPKDDSDALSFSGSSVEFSLGDDYSITDGLSAADSSAYDITLEGTGSNSYSIQVQETGLTEPTK